LVAVPAVHRPVFPGLERRLGIFPAGGANRRVHLTVLAGIASAVTSPTPSVLRLTCRPTFDAVKFTDSGEVVLLVHMEDEDPDSVTLRFEVRDTGSNNNLPYILRQVILFIAR